MPKKPIKFTDKLYAKILDAVRNGHTLAEIAGEPWAPARATIYAWFDDPKQGATRLRAYDQACERREITWKDDAVATYQELLRRVKDADEDLRPTKDELTTAKAHVTFVMTMIREARQERKGANAVGRPPGQAGDEDSPDGVIVELVIFSDTETPVTVPLEDLAPLDDDFADEDALEFED